MWKKILKVAGCIIVLGILLLIATYNDHDNAIACTFFVYVSLISYYFPLKKSYKDWEESAEYNEFYKRFIKRYDPFHFIFWGVVVLAFAAKFFNFWGNLVILLFVTTYDLWDRRYITTDIKQDLILEKLEKK